MITSHIRSAKKYGIIPYNTYQKERSFIILFSSERSCAGVFRIGSIEEVLEGKESHTLSLPRDRKDRSLSRERNRVEL